VTVEVGDSSGLELVKGGGVVVGFSREVCASSGSVGCWDSVVWLCSSSVSIGVDLSWSAKSTPTPLG